MSAKPFEVKCPFCLKTLYRTVRVGPSDLQGAPGNPALEKGPDGPFMRCPACNREVRMEQTTSASGGAAVRVAKLQGPAPA